MPSLTIKNIPDVIYKKLKRRAERHKRSLNKEILHCLETSVEVGKTNVQDLVNKARNAKEGINYIISDKEVSINKQSGRL